MDFQPAILRGTAIRLEPLAHRHAEGLYQAGNFPELWEFTADPQPGTLKDVRGIIDEVLAQGDDCLGFATVLQSDGRVVGSTRMYPVNTAHGIVEIGYTWVTPEFHGSGVNAEAKRLMLGHAFDTLGLMRVEMKTDALNLRSQRAMEAIGASRDGLFRRHRKLYSGRVRDTVYYSVVDTDWPRIKAHLDTLLRAKGILS